MEAGSRFKVIEVVGHSEYGGGAWSIGAVSLGAQRAGFDVRVLASAESLARYFGQLGLEVIRTPIIRRDVNLVRDLFSLVEVARWLRRLAPALVHTHTSKGGFIGRIAAHLAGVPAIVHTVHGFAFHDYSPRTQKRFYVLLEKMAGRVSDRVITVSRYHQELALALGIAGPEKILAIQNGIDWRRLQPRRQRNEVRREFCVPTDKALVVACGRLVPQKGLETLVSAMESLRDSCVALIVGEGPSRSKLVHQVENAGLGGCVRFAGFRRDVADLVCAADVFTMPSLWEGLSVALLEAMALGAPIVASDIGPNVELVEHGVTGLVAKAGDPASLAGGIRRLLEDPDSGRSLGQAAAERVKREFTEERMVGDTISEYERLLSQPSPPKAGASRRNWSGQRPTGSID